MPKKQAVLELTDTSHLEIVEEVKQNKLDIKDLEITVAEIKDRTTELLDAIESEVHESKFCTKDISIYKVFNAGRETYDMDKLKILLINRGLTADEVTDMMTGITKAGTPYSYWGSRFKKIKG